MQKNIRTLSKRVKNTTSCRDGEMSFTNIKLIYSVTLFEKNHCPQFFSLTEVQLTNKRCIYVRYATWCFDVSMMFKLVLEKAEEPQIKLPTSAGSSEKQKSSRKTSISALLTMPKPLTVWITINCGIYWKRWEYQTTWPASWEICMQVNK